jgi:hypothetical protein
LIELRVRLLEARNIIPNPIMVITSVDVSGIGDAGGGIKIGSGSKTSPESPTELTGPEGGEPDGVE